MTIPDPRPPRRRPRRELSHSRNAADTGDLVVIDRDDMRMVVGDNEVVTLYVDGYTAEVIVLDNTPAPAPDTPARATVQVRFVPAPYVAPVPVEPDPPLRPGRPLLNPAEREPDPGS